MAAESVGPSISFLTYNLLSAVYAAKWGEREGVASDGSSNWSARWPVMRDEVLAQAWCDVICMQEVDECVALDVARDLHPAYRTFYFKHMRRPPDGLMIAVLGRSFKTEIQKAEIQHDGVAFGRVDLVHAESGAATRVVTAHCRGGQLEQLAALALFADEDNVANVTVVAADFNEDFQTDGRCPLPSGERGAYSTLPRGESLPQFSRPPHKQAEDQSSGKGKVDWIFVRARPRHCSVELFRDEPALRAIKLSHAPCEATGQWPSDHGAEAVCARFLEFVAEPQPEAVEHGCRSQTPAVD